MYKIFDTLEQYNQFTDNGTHLTAGILYLVKENKSLYFQTNNIDGEMKKYYMMDNEDLIDLIEMDIKSLNIPNGTTKIVSYAFYKCSSLTSVTIPNSVTSIGVNAFNQCIGLTSITIPNSVTSIDNGAFRKCTSLTSIIIGSNVTSIGQNAFNNCTGLTSVTIEATNPPTLSSDAFNNTNNCPIYVPAESLEVYKTATNWSVYADRLQVISE